MSWITPAGLIVIICILLFGVLKQSWSIDKLKNDLNLARDERDSWRSACEEWEKRWTRSELTPKRTSKAERRKSVKVPETEEPKKRAIQI